jgi:hypothetical protein
MLTLEEKLLKVIEKYRILMLTVNKQKGVREAALASDSLYHTRCLENKLRKAQGDSRTLLL